MVKMAEKKNTNVRLRRAQSEQTSARRIRVASGFV